MNPQFRRLNLALVCFTVSICVLSSCTVHEKPPLVTAPQMPTSPQTLPSAGAVATEEEKPTVNETAVTALNSGQLIPSYSLFGGQNAVQCDGKIYFSYARLLRTMDKKMGAVHLPCRSPLRFVRRKFTKNFSKF